MRIEFLEISPLVPRAKKFLPRGRKRITRICHFRSRRVIWFLHQSILWVRIDRILKCPGNVCWSRLRNGIFSEQVGISLPLSVSSENTPFEPYPVNTSLPNRVITKTTWTKNFMSISTSTMKTATLIWTTGILGGAVTLSLYHLLRIHNKTRDIPPRQIKSSPSVPATFHKSAAVSIVNPHSHSPVHDTRSISLRLPSRLGDEEILARFIKGFCRFFLHPGPLFQESEK